MIKTAILRRPTVAEWAVGPGAGDRRQKAKERLGRPLAWCSKNKTVIVFSNTTKPWKSLDRACLTSVHLPVGIWRLRSKRIHPRIVKMTVCEFGEHKSTPAEEKMLWTQMWIVKYCGRSTTDESWQAPGPRPRTIQVFEVYQRPMGKRRSEDPSAPEFGKTLGKSTVTLDHFLGNAELGKGSTWIDLKQQRPFYPNELGKNGGFSPNSKVVQVGWHSLSPVLHSDCKRGFLFFITTKSISLLSISLRNRKLHSVAPSVFLKNEQNLSRCEATKFSHFLPNLRAHSSPQIKFCSFLNGSNLWWTIG